MESWKDGTLLEEVDQWGWACIAGLPSNPTSYFLFSHLSPCFLCANGIRSSSFCLLFFMFAMLSLPWWTRCFWKLNPRPFLLWVVFGHGTLLLQQKSNKYGNVARLCCQHLNNQRFMSVITDNQYTPSELLSFPCIWLICFSERHVLPHSFIDDNIQRWHRTRHILPATV